jgi:hypothetical protein
MIVEVDGFGNFDLPDVIETDTVTLQNYKETVWHKIDFVALERKHPHVTWILEDSTYHKQVGNRQRYHHNHPFYFLWHVVWLGLRKLDGDNKHMLASDESDLGPRQFCFLNNFPRSYRVKLWDRMSDEGLLNEYCSFISRGHLVGGKRENFVWGQHGHEFSMRPPFFYDSVGADLFVETHPKSPLFFTEKTWKPLFYGKVPLGFGPRHYYKTLMGLGFKFSKHLDYTFDELEDTAERFEMFYEQVKHYLSLPLSLKNDYADHNKRKCFELLMSSQPAPQDIPEGLIKTKGQEFLRLGRVLNPEERDEYWNNSDR